MTRNLRALGLALVAALAMSAVAASAASAEPFTFDAESAPVTLVGTQHSGNDVFTTTAGTVSCTTANYTGSQAATETSEVEVFPTYSGCTAFGFASATIHPNGCGYRFTAGTTTKVETEDKIVHTFTEGTVDIVCPKEKEITVTASLFGTSKCVVHVPPQNDLGTVTFTNVGLGTTREVTVDVNLSGIKYSHTKGTGFGACTTGSASNGTYSGVGLVTGKNGSGAHVGLFVT